MIQGQGAETIKLSLILFYRWILKNNYFGKVKIVSTIHDEINTEHPIKYTNEVANNLTKSMEDAGSYYCKIIPLKADAVTNPYWKH